MLDQNWAQSFAQEWINAWNDHDLERILSHYADDFQMHSPLIVERMNEPSGVLRGKDILRSYWQRGLAATPPLHFELVEVFVGVRSITLYYRSLARRLVAEVLVFNESGEVIQGISHHGKPTPSVTHSE